MRPPLLPRDATLVLIACGFVSEALLLVTGVGRAKDCYTANYGPPAYDGSTAAVDAAADGGAESPQPAASTPPGSVDGSASTITSSGAAESESNAARADPMIVAASAAVGRDDGICDHARLTRATTAGGASGRNAARLGRSPFCMDTRSTPALGRRLDASAHALVCPVSRHHRRSAKA